MKRRRSQRAYGRAAPGRRILGVTLLALIGPGCSNGGSPSEPSTADSSPLSFVDSRAGDGGVVDDVGAPDVVRTSCSRALPCPSATERCCGGFCFAEGCVDTLSGSGIVGAPDDTIDKAFINGIYRMLPDGQGNLFFSEWIAAGGIRVLNRGTTPVGRVPAGSVGRLGSGVFGCKAGPMAQAEMRTPIGLTRDSTGNLYVVDQGCRVVWKISAEFATVSLVAGAPDADAEVRDGTGSAASFHSPRDVALGPDGKLYVSEIDAYVIRRVAPDTGEVSTLAGKPLETDHVDGSAANARFVRPAGLAFGDGGTLFVADWDSGAVRQIDDATGSNPVVSTIGITQPDPDPDPDPRRVWLRKLGWAGHASLSVAPQQTLYVNFWANGVHRLTPPATVGAEWLPTKVVSTSRVISNSLDAAKGVLWVGGWVNDPRPESGTHTISRYTVAETLTLTDTVGQPAQVGVRDGAPGEATFAWPLCGGALARDGDGNLWIADRCANRVRKIGPAGQVSSFGTGRYAVTPGTATTAEFCGPTAIGVVGGEVYVVNMHCGGKISQIDGTGNVTVVGSICPASEDGISEGGGDLCPLASALGGIVADKAGNLYVTTYSEGGAGRSDKYGKSYWDGMPTIVKIPNMGADRATFFAGTPNNPADPAERGKCVEGAPGTGQFGVAPRGLAIDSEGVMYVGDLECGLRKVAADGTITNLNRDLRPVAVALGPGSYGAETLYVSNDDVIVQVNRSNGEAKDYAGRPSSYEEHFRDGALADAIFWGPQSLVVDAQGVVYVLDRYNNRVRTVYPNP